MQGVIIVYHDNPLMNINLKESIYLPAQLSIYIFTYLSRLQITVLINSECWLSF